MRIQGTAQTSDAACGVRPCRAAGTGGSSSLGDSTGAAEPVSSPCWCRSPGPGTGTAACGVGSGAIFFVLFLLIGNVTIMSTFVAMTFEVLTFLHVLHRCTSLTPPVDHLRLVAGVQAGAPHASARGKASAAQVSPCSVLDARPQRRRSVVGSGVWCACEGGSTFAAGMEGASHAPPCMARGSAGKALDAHATLQ